MNVNTPNSPHTYAYDNRVAHASTSNTGENPVADLSVVPPSAVEVRCPAHPGLQDMPVELLHNIFSRLSYIEKVVVKSTFLAADWVVNGLLSTESKRWFSRFSPQQQAKLKKIAEGTDVQVIRTWLEQFTKEEKVVKHLIDNRHHRHYHELLFYTVSQLMADCQAFKIRQVASIEHTDTVVLSIFSDDGNHMLTQSFSGQSKICSLSPGGNWMEKITIYDEYQTHFSLSHFSGDSKHVKIGRFGSPNKIYALNSDGNWVVETILPQGRNIKFTEFSPDGLHVAIIDKTNTLRFYGQEKDGAWAEEEKGTFSDRVYHEFHKFNRSSNELVAVSKDWELLIYRRGSDGRWTEKAILPNKTNTYVYQVSPNDNHMITLHFSEGIAKIFGRGPDGKWMEQTVIDHQAVSADFSPNSRYLVINSDNTAAVYYLDINGSWIEKASLDSISIPTAGVISFISFDGRFLVIPVNDDSVKIYGLGADGQCTEMTRINRATHAFFSNDGNHIFTYYYHPGIFNNNSRLLRIYGLSQDGKLKLKGTIDHGHRIRSATISPTGRYVVTNGDDGKAKIWILRSSTENEPGPRKVSRE